MTLDHESLGSSPSGATNKGVVMNREEVAIRLFIELIKNDMEGRTAAKQSVELANMLINELNKDGLKSRTKKDYYSPVHNGPHTPY